MPTPLFNLLKDGKHCLDESISKCHDFKSGVPDPSRFGFPQRSAIISVISPTDLVRIMFISLKSSNSYTFRPMFTVIRSI
jgi:hypothetical protein